MATTAPPADPNLERKKVLARMPLEALQQQKQNMEEQLQGIMSSHMQLRTALNRFSNSKDTIRQFAQQEPGHEMLVPLTNSLYVPGRIESVEGLLVDVGTGYFIEKSSAQAQEFLSRKIQMIAAKVQDLERVAAAQREQLDTVVSVMTTKSRILQAQAQQQQAQA